MNEAKVHGDPTHDRLVAEPCPEERFHTMKWKRLILFAGTCAFLVLTNNVIASPTYYFNGLSARTPMVVDEEAGEIRLLAVLQPEAFGKGWFTHMPGHHAVTWKGGRKADEALLTTFVSDSELYDAMIAIGAKPGNNLTQAVWEERNDPSSTAPEMRVQGSPVDVFVWWKGLPKPLEFSKLVNDSNVKGIELRFGGHKALIPVWKSGCIVCLQSCPGGKISNQRYTIRDYVEGRATFTVNRSVVPEGARKAVVIFRLTDHSL
jgi:hypothetical protein